MKRLGRLISLALVLLAVTAILPTAVFAQQIDGDEKRIDGDQTYFENANIDTNTTINGDIAVFGGDLDLDGTINGDVVVFGGDVEIEGEINGDLIIFGGDVSVTDSGSVAGECALIGGNFSDGHDATTDRVVCTLAIENEWIAGFMRDIDYNGLTSSFLDEIEEGLPPELVPYPEAPIEPNFDAQEWDNYDEHYDQDNSVGFVGRLINAIGSALLVGFIAYMIMSSTADRVYQVRQVLQAETGASAGVGLLSMIAIPSALTIIALLTAVLIFICIGIVGIPLLIVATLGYAVALLLGITAVGSLMGDRLAERLALKGWSIPMRTAFGTAAIVFGLGLLALVPCFPEGLISFVVWGIGLGGVVLTKFGTQPYPRIVVDESKVYDVDEHI